MTSSKCSFTGFAIVAAVLFVSLPDLVRAAGVGDTEGTARDSVCFLVPADSLHAVDAGDHVEVTICQRRLFDEQFPVIHRNGSAQYSFEFEAPDDVKSPVERGSFIDHTIALIE